VPAKFSVADRIAERADLTENAQHIGHHVFAPDDDGIA
jgi:hypothetical protein